jgi:leucyl-tRNA synthetase
MMEFVNAVYREGAVSRDQTERFVLVLAPFAPHLAEELWQMLGHSESLACEPFPSFDAALVVDEMLELPVQVNGKLRARISVPADAAEADILAAAREEPKVAAILAGKAIIKELVVPGRLVNFVVKG